MNTTIITNVHQFSYKSKGIRAFVTKNDAWFVLTDVCEAINASVNDVLGFLDIKEFSPFNLDDLTLTCVSECGCYHIVLDLHTQLDLVEFRKWVSSVVTQLLSQSTTDLPTQFESTKELQLIDQNGIKLVDSRIVAEELGLQHESLIKNINSTKGVIEEKFGRLRFEIGVANNAVLGSNPPKYALLTEDQTLFIGALSRNNPKVVEFKARLVKAFQNARRAAQSLLQPNTQGLERISSVETKIDELSQMVARLLSTKKTTTPIVTVDKARLKSLQDQLATAGMKLTMTEMLSNAVVALEEKIITANHGSVSSSQQTAKNKVRFFLETETILIKNKVICLESAIIKLIEMAEFGSTSTVSEIKEMEDKLKNFGIRSDFEHNANKFVLWFSDSNKLLKTRFLRFGQGKEICEYLNVVAFTYKKSAMRFVGSATRATGISFSVLPDGNNRKRICFD